MSFAAQHRCPAPLSGGLPTLRLTQFAIKLANDPSIQIVGTLRHLINSSDETWVAPEYRLRTSVDLARREKNDRTRHLLTYYAIVSQILANPRARDRLLPGVFQHTHLTGAAEPGH